MLLVVSTFGPFSFVEAAIALTGISLLALLKQRAEGKEFHLPGGDGTVIALAGLWSALLILTRILDRPLGQSVLAFACAAIVAAAGLRERTKHPAEPVAPSPQPRPSPRRSQDEDATARLPADEDETVRISTDDEHTIRLPPTDT